MELGEQIATLREEKTLTQVELAEKANISPSTLSQIESGRVPRPHVGTMRKIARALGVEPAELRKVSPEELTARPKVQASLWPEEEPERRNPEPSEAELETVNKLAAEYLVGRAEKHDAEVADPNSPHFANATAAALWLAGVEDERAAWLDWWAELQEVTTPAREDFGAAVATTAEQWLLALGAVLAFDLLTNRTEERIKAMNDTPDQLAARRLEVATAAAEASRKRLEDQREAASG